jgi:hypothetical protein
MRQRNSVQTGARLWAFILVLAVVLLYPFKSTVVPEQNVLVVTEDWRPIQGIEVRQIWQNYSLEADGHEEGVRTDESGRVTLPHRTIRASVLRRIVHPAWNILRQGVHASFGVHTDLLVLGDVKENQLGQQAVKAKPGDIVYRLR